MAPPKSNGKLGTDSDWGRADRAILDKLGEHGIIDAYRASGLKWPSSYKIDANGNAGHVVKGSDSSIKINLKTGWYRDWNGDESGSLWDWCERHGKFSDWRAARQHFAERTGVTLPSKGGEHRRGPRGKKMPKSPADHGRVLDKFTDNLAPMAEFECEKAKAGGHLDRIAKEMGGVCPFALEDCGVGYLPPDSVCPENFNLKAGYSIWPEWNINAESGKLTVSTFTQRRPPENIIGEKKVCLYRRSRGLTIPKGWQERVRRTGELIIPEGQSDAAGATSMGLGALAYWSAGVGAEQLHWTISRAIGRGEIPERFRVILTQDIDNSHYPNPKAPGLAQELADRLGLPVWVRMMPENPDWERPVEKDTLCKTAERQPSEREENAMSGDPNYENWLWCKERERIANLPPPFPRVYKDVRAWLAAKVPNAHLKRRGELDHVGLMFVNELMGGDYGDDDAGVYLPRKLNTECDGPERDENTKSDITKGLANFRDELEAQNKHTTYTLASYCNPKGAGSSLLIPSSKRTTRPFSGDRDASIDVVVSAEDGREAALLLARLLCCLISHRMLSRPTLDYGCVSDLMTRDHIECPDEIDVYVRSLEDEERGLIVTKVCRRWNCVCCGPTNRLSWARLAYRRLLPELSKCDEFYVWRGPQHEGSNARLKSVRKLDGKYVVSVRWLGVLQPGLI